MESPTDTGGKRWLGPALFTALLLAIVLFFIWLL